MRQYAEVFWTIDDIKEIKPEWTDDQCDEWLIKNQKRLRERMIEEGWNIISILLEK